MSDLIITKEMKNNPIRVPVMMQKGIAERLAACLLKYGKTTYDETLEKIIQAGIAAISHRTGNDPDR